VGEGRRAEVKITCAPIRTFAYGHALTMREWESLGRFAMRVEFELPKLLEESVGDLLAYVQVKTIKDFAKPEIRRMLEVEGLNPRDWYIHIEPRLPECAPFPKHVESWILHMRLMGEASTAKLQVAGDTEKKHAPTLSEQFGKE
jgi:hypothetical protein